MGARGGSPANLAPMLLSESDHVTTGNNRPYGEELAGGDADEGKGVASMRMGVRGWGVRGGSHRSHERLCEHGGRRKRDTTSNKFNPLRQGQTFCGGLTFDL